MFARLPLKTALGAAALAAAGLMLTPAAASAQVYSYQGAPQAYGSGYNNQSSYGYGQSGYGYQQRPDYGYDRSGYGHCRSERNQRQGAGVAVGATFGAVLGSQMGARGRRTEGSVLGAVIGGALGAAVGNSSAGDCNGNSGHYGYDDRRYTEQSGYGYDDRGYGNQSGYSNQSGYGYGYDDRGYSRQGNDPYRADDRYDDRGYQYQDDRYRSDCRPVAVSSRDQYGRVVTRYQQTC